MGRERMMYMYKADLQVFPFKRIFFFRSVFVCLVSPPHAPLFSLAAQPMMLRRWKTAGVIFTGGQGTWVIKRLHFPQPEKKTLPCLPSPVPPPPPFFTFPVKAQDLSGKSVSCVGERRCAHTQTRRSRFRHGRDRQTHTGRSCLM